MKGDILGQDYILFFIADIFCCLNNRLRLDAVTPLLSCQSTEHQDNGVLHATYRFIKDT